MRTQTLEIQQNLTPEMALQILKDGNNRFINNLKANRNLLQQVNETSDGQFPFATILSCMDSRTSAELVFDQGLGDVFSIRVAGNILNDDIIASIEYASKIIGTKIILILGHTKCGAVTGACQNVELGKLSVLFNKMKEPIQLELDKGIGPDHPDFIPNVTINNIKHVIAELPKESEIIKEQLNKEEILVVGAVYNVDSGEVTFLN